ncbi:hypothetical protein NC652_033192 [Populus alba x Populus x berolinensis]|nr:hypothetical protein NC652_033192 [Populus alba x Populus x berolinensis]
MTKSSTGNLKGQRIRGRQEGIRRLKLMMRYLRFTPLASTGESTKVLAEEATVRTWGNTKRIRVDV